MSAHVIVIVIVTLRRLDKPDDDNVWHGEGKDRTLFSNKLNYEKTESEPF